MDAIDHVSANVRTVLIRYANASSLLTMAQQEADAAYEAAQELEGYYSGDTHADLEQTGEHLDAAQRGLSAFLTEHGASR
tara:strand:+ start:1157 stop:1396 length:240 start_codon:yes stop_codon:yes gene_type:complete